MRLNDHRRAVQTLYTEVDVQRDVQAQKTAGRSLRQIAADYGRPVLHTDVERILQGVFPKGKAKRDALHLAPVCPTCEQPIRRHRQHNDNTLVVDKIHGTGAGRLGDLVANLRQLEALSQVAKDPDRMYARGGKRIRLA